MAATTSSTLDDLFANIIMQARFTAEEQSLMAGLITRYDIGNVAGTTIQVPKYPAVTAADLTEGTDLTSSTVSTSGVTVTVGEVGAQVLLTDLAAMGAGNPAQELGTVLGNSIATKMDKDIIALFDGFSTALGAAGQEITVADLFKAAATLRANKALGPVYAVVHPFHAYQLSANLTNTFANPNGGDLQNEAMRNGVVFTREAMCIAMKRDFNLETERDASNRAFELNATAVYGVGELDDSYGVEMLFDAAL